MKYQNQIHEAIKGLPITSDQQIMEQWARMDYIESAYGELYATFIQVNDILLQVTEYKPFEEAWIDYLSLFDENHPSHIEADEELWESLMNDTITTSTIELVDVFETLQHFVEMGY